MDAMEVYVDTTIVSQPATATSGGPTPFYEITTREAATYPYHHYHYQATKVGGLQ